MSDDLTVVKGSHQFGFSADVRHVARLDPGDEGFPDGKTGLDVQWWNLSPRAGVAWDLRGDGRLALRSSYSLGYDFMAGEYHNINAGAPPFGNRSLINDPPGRMDDPGAPSAAILTPIGRYSTTTVVTAERGS